MDTRFLNVTFQSNNDNLSIGKETDHKLIKIEGIESSDYEINIEQYMQYDGGYTKKKRILPREILIVADYRIQKV